MNSRNGSVKFLGGLYLLLASINPYALERPGIYTRDPILSTRIDLYSSTKILNVKRRMKTHKHWVLEVCYMRKTLEHKIIETVFDGYKFRSRLEARWAVFFKTLGIKYKYETEGFDLPSGYYLPDFWLPNEGCWIEIKPDGTPGQSISCFWLAKITESDVLYIVGEPWPNEYAIQLYTHYLLPDEKERAVGEPMSSNFQFGEDRKASSCLWITGEEGAHSLTPSNDPKHGDKWPMDDTPWLRNAYEAARQARFEQNDRWKWND